MIVGYSLKGKRVWVAGHGGMVGSALCPRLGLEDCEILTIERGALDLRRQADVEGWMVQQRPDAVIVAAATVGGIMANSTRPAEFLYDNMMIAGNIVQAAHSTNTEKLLYLGSSCIYPRLAPQPISEEALLTAALEPTNQWYAVAKISGLMLCRAYRRQYGRDFISAMPTNLYGPLDNFSLESSHVIPALMVKAHNVKNQQSEELVVWGSGSPRREFLYVDDLADALVLLLKEYSGEQHINIGYGTDVSIRDLAKTVCSVVGIAGPIHFDSTKPDGTPQKLLDSRRLSEMGWRPHISLQEGLRKTYNWFLDNEAAIRAQNLARN